MSTQPVQYMLLFLVLVINFTELHARLTLAARSYALLVTDIPVEMALEILLCG